MKKLLIAILILTLTAANALATILPAAGVDEEFRAWTGIECTPAIVLCQSLSVYDERGDQGGRKVNTLYYSIDGMTVPVIESWDGWAKIYYADGTQTGWVRSDYLLMDPAWYVCDDAVQVYAYPDTMAPRVALLGTGDELPIITQWEDGQDGWVCVSLRGAAGWIRKTVADTAEDTWFRPEMLADINTATLTWQGEAISVSYFDPEDVAALAALLVSATDMGGEVAGCPFDATLELCLWDGQVIELQLATDSCCVYRVDGRDYQYARHLVTGEGNPDNTVLLNIFGLDAWEDLLLPGNG